MNFVGKASNVFPWEGTEAVSKRLTASAHVQTEYSVYNHWLYLEDPGSFNHVVAEFATRHS